jgi:hypothetical protein
MAGDSARTRLHGVMFKLWRREAALASGILLISMQNYPGSWGKQR